MGLARMNNATTFDCNAMPSTYEDMFSSIIEYVGTPEKCRTCLQESDDYRGLLTKDVETYPKMTYYEMVTFCAGVHWDDFGSDAINAPQNICFECIGRLKAAYAFKLMIMQNKIKMMSVDASSNNNHKVTSNFSVVEQMPAEQSAEINNQGEQIVDDVPIGDVFVTDVSQPVTAELGEEQVMTGFCFEGYDGQTYAVAGEVDQTELQTVISCPLEVFELLRFNNVDAGIAVCDTYTPTANPLNANSNGNAETIHADGQIHEEFIEMEVFDATTVAHLQQQCAETEADLESAMDFDLLSNGGDAVYSERGGKDHIGAYEDTQIKNLICEYSNTDEYIEELEISSMFDVEDNAAATERNTPDLVNGEQSNSSVYHVELQEASTNQSSANQLSEADVANVIHEETIETANEVANGLVTDIDESSNSVIAATPYECHQCDRTYAQPSRLRVHEKVHSDDTPFVCDVCNKGFKQRKNLLDHSVTHTDFKPFQCNICKHFYRTSSSLAAHKRIHNKIKPYHCTVCGRSFAAVDHLRRHNMTHTGEKPYKCDECPKTYYDAASLRQHKLCGHLGIKKFECEFCGIKLTQKSGYKKHLLLHEGRRDHECVICNRSFTHKSNLSSHMKLHCKDKPFKCEKCPESFVSNNRLLTHNRQHEREEAAKPVLPNNIVLTLGATVNNNDCMQIDVDDDDDDDDDILQLAPLPVNNRAKNSNQSNFVIVT